MPLSINLATNDRDYADAIAVRNLDLDHEPISIAEARHFEACHPPDLTRETYLGRSEAGHPVARCAIRQQRSDTGSLMNLDVNVTDPKQTCDWQEAFDFLTRRASQLGATTLVASTRNTRPEIANLLVERGFELSQQNPVSVLKTADINLETYRALIEKAKANGIETLDLNQYIALKGEDWKRGYWETTVSLLKDVPFPVPFELPFEDFERWLSNPSWDYSTTFTALHEGELVGITEIEQRQADKRIGSTQLTAVTREYRRQGIAAALKAFSILHVQARGVESITTDNEEDNPMYTLNVQLGFKPMFSWMIYKKEVG
jgi:hypothetical protein